jgi:hypothetical protein
MIKYYLFCIRWLYKNRNWDNTRQKFKAMQRDYESYIKRGTTR